MNRVFIFMVALCNIIFLGAMEKEQILFPITQQENDFFALSVKTSVQISNKAVEDRNISPHNAMHIIAHKCSIFLQSADNDLSKMIEDQGLISRLEDFKRFEGDKIVKQCKQKIVGIKTNVELFNEYKKELYNRRVALAQLDLHYQQPTYRESARSSNRIDFMFINEFFSLSEAAEKDYIALFIYENALAYRIDIYNEAL